MIRYNLILITLLGLSSCMTPQRMQRICSICPEKIVEKDSIIYRDKVEIRDSIVEKEKIIVSPADSAGWKAYLECIDGKVVIKNTETSNGSKIKISPKLIGNTLYVNCKTIEDSLKVLYQEHHILEQKYSSLWQQNQKIITLPPKISNILTWWQKLFIIIGIFASIVVVIRFAFWLGKTYVAVQTGGISSLPGKLLSLLKIFT